MDGHRGLLAGLAALGLLGLCLRFARLAETETPAWQRCLAPGVPCAGATVVLPLYRVVAVENGGELRISKLIRDVPVHPPPGVAVAVGDTVTVEGHFAGADGRVVADRLTRHPLRPVKEGLGLLGLALALVAAPLAFGWVGGWPWRGGRLVERG